MINFLKWVYIVLAFFSLQATWEYAPIEMPSAPLSQSFNHYSSRTWRIMRAFELKFIAQRWCTNEFS